MNIKKLIGCFCCRDTACRVFTTIKSMHPVFYFTSIKDSTCLCRMRLAHQCLLTSSFASIVAGDPACGGQALRSPVFYQPVGQVPLGPDNCRSNLFRDSTADVGCALRIIGRLSPRCTWCTILSLKNSKLTTHNPQPTTLFPKRVQSAFIFQSPI